MRRGCSIEDIAPWFIYEKIRETKPKRRRRAASRVEVQTRQMTRQLMMAASFYLCSSLNPIWINATDPLKAEMYVSH